MRTHPRSDAPDWVADPAPPPRREEGAALWWGVTPRVARTTLAGIVVAGAVGAGVWASVPATEDISVPEGYLHIAPALAPAAPGEPGGHEVIVHVAGAVAGGGVVELREGDRVHDAIREAGGPAPGADLGRINLAAKVADGQYIYVPAEGEDPPPGAGGEPGAGGGPLDLNRATAQELQTLAGIGPVLAQRIVSHREANGPFATVEDLQSVPGIGPALMGALREDVRV